MDTGTPENYYMRMEFDDVDHLTETVREWDLSYSQLEAGLFSGEVAQARAGQVMIGHGRCNRRMEQGGATPHGMRTFVVPVDPTLRMLWRGKDVCGEQVLAFPLGGELEAMTRQGFEVFTLTIPEHLLADVAGDAGLPDVDDLLGGEEVTSCAPQAMTRLRRQFSLIFSELKKRPLKTGHPDLQNTLEYELPSRLLRTLAKSRLVTGSASPTRRHQAVEKARAWFDAHPDKPITIRDLCRVTGVSERTLQYAFRDYAGVTPKSYLQARRLNGVRRLLRTATPGTRVADVANRWEFWHMGQFAADYRKMFGELPSSTLAKSRR